MLLLSLLGDRVHVLCRGLQLRLLRQQLASGSATVSFRGIKEVRVTSGLRRSLHEMPCKWCHRALLQRMDSIEVALNRERSLLGSILEERERNLLLIMNAFSRVGKLAQVL